MHYAIIGGSAAGVNAVEGVRSIDKKSKITLISDEDYLLYSRCLLSYFVAGKLPEEKLKFKPADFYKANSVEAKLGVRAEKLDLKNKKISLSDKSSIEYDKLLLATGASAKMENIKGIDKKGVFALRTIKDAKGILSMIKSVKTTAVLGGGLVGLKAAYALHEQGKKIKVVVKSKQVLSQILDTDGASYIQEFIQKKGIEVMTGVAATEVTGNGAVKGLLLDNGSKLDCELVIIGKGVSPNMELIKDTEVKTHWGILTDETQKTTAQDIYAAGDVAETFDFTQQSTDTNAIWPAACWQGKIAGLNMAGKKAVYEGSMAMNSVEFFGMPTISMGITKPKTEEFQQLARKEKESYRKIVLKDNRIVGVVMVGKIDNAGVIGLLMRKKIDVSGLKDLLLDDNFDFAKVMPLIKENKESFKEEEFEHII